MAAFPAGPHTPLELSRPVRVFLVDDSESFRVSAGCYLARQSACGLVGVATSAEEALDRLPESEADLVLVDVGLPGMSGFELVRRLKVRPNAPRVAVITVHDDAAYRDAARAAGAEGFIAKSEFTWQVLLVIREVAEGLRAGEAPPDAPV